jgi:DNA polymerase-1
MDSINHPAAQTHAGTYRTIDTEADFDAWIRRLNAAQLVSVDTETTSLSPMQAKLVGISFCIESQQAAYLPLMHNYTGVPAQLSIDWVLSRLKPWLENAEKPKLGQNLKYDKHVFANHGIELNGIAHDTLLQSYVLESHRPHNMDSMALRHLDIKTISYDEVTGKGVNRIGFDEVAIDTATQYAAEDADITLRLHQHLYPSIKNDDRLDYIYREIEMPILDVLFAIERNGVLLDYKLLQNQSHELGGKLQALEQQAYTLRDNPLT